MKTKKIFFVGTGSMGNPMAANLLRAGHPLRVLDKHPDQYANLIEQGASAAHSLAEGAKDADVAIVSLPGPPEVRDVLLGDEGLIAAMPDGATVIDTSTSSVELAKEIARYASERNVHYLEAPITNAVDAAREGRLGIFVGGSSEVFAEQEDIFNILGTQVLFVGNHGNGSITKLVTNQMWFVAAAAIGEGLMLGAKAGVPLETLSEAIRSSAGNSWVAEHDIPSIFAGHYDPSFTLALCCKDLGLIREIAAANQLELPMTEKAGERFEMARDKYGPDAAELHVARLLEDKEGLLLRPNQGREGSTQ